MDQHPVTYMRLALALDGLVESVWGYAHGEPFEPSYQKIWDRWLAVGRLLAGMRWCKPPRSEKIRAASESPTGRGEGPGVSEEPVQTPQCRVASRRAYYTLDLATVWAGTPESVCLGWKGPFRAILRSMDPAGPPLGPSHGAT
jgi:hypothetical protein